MERKVLLVDDQPCVLEIMTLYIELCEDCEILTAASGNEAIEILKKDSEIDLVISDFNMPNGTGGDVYHFLNDLDREILFVLQTAEPIEILEEFTGFPSRESERFIQKPFTCDQITEVVSSLLSIKSSERSDDDYISVAISTFKKYSQIGVEAYLQLSESKYVKFHHAEDDLDYKTISKYEKKGVTSFYLKKSSYENFIASCQNHLKDVLLSPNVNREELEKAQFDTVENMRTAIETIGVDPLLLDQAEQLSSSIVNNISDQSEIKGLMDKLQNGSGYLSQLSLMVGYVVVALASEVSWADRNSYDKLVMASLFMDIVWFEYDQEEYCEQWGEITNKNDLQLKSLHPNIQQAIKNHSVESAKLFDQIRSDSDIYNLICDHHERPGGVGFPKGIFEQQISSLAAILTLSHEFCSRILLLDEFNMESFTKVKQGILIEFKEGRYKEPCQAFSKIFC